MADAGHERRGAGFQDKEGGEKSCGDSTFLLYLLCSDGELYALYAIIVAFMEAKDRMMCFYLGWTSSRRHNI